MGLELLLADVPEYAKDLRLNLQTLLKQPELTERQTWGTAVASAIASRNSRLTAAVLEDAAQHLDAGNLRAAKAAAAIMGMNNVYYRFLHLTPNPKYREMPARLRMQAIRAHGGDPVDFELWCLVVSSINACPACVESHERVLRDKGTGEEAILGAVRIAAVMYAVAGVLGVE
jgi:lipoyl-dependent peroxiredoxin subunit D